MTDKEKFEGLKRELVEEHEKSYGDEARNLYGDKAVDDGARKVLGMSKGEFDEWQELENEILALLENAVNSGADPAGAEGERICCLHRKWLSHTWSTIIPEAYRGLAETYVADERFKKYYDRAVPGCAQWLHDAIVAHTK